MNDVICGECSAVMAGFPDNFVDLVVTSPPYGNLRSYNGFVFNHEHIVSQLYRITKVGGVVVWVVGDQVIDGEGESGESFRQALFFKDAGFRLHDTMIYEKSGCSLPDKTRYFQCFEYMFVFSKGTPNTINFIEDRKNRFTERWGEGKKVRNKDGSFSPRKVYPAKEYGKRFNIWRYSVGGQGYGHTDDIAHKHPATFPEKLAEDHILSWSNPGDLVLDPMCGSGTTLKMANKNNRKYIGIDMSEAYCINAVKRAKLGGGAVLLKDKNQLSLFEAVYE